ncbi:MAG: hypothetical protein ACI8SE_001740 [Bacteroidia bacterium]|jgi:hypothetical protein
MENTFVEIQRYRKWWMLIIVASLLVLPILSVFRQIIMDKPFGNNPVSDGMLIVFTSVMVLLAILFLSVFLKTEVGWDGIAFHYAPFFKKQILWSQVATAEIVDYGFLGGWGFRYSKKYGMVYNVTGRIGMAITLVNNKKFVIGTQKPEALKQVLKKYIPNLEPQWVTPVKP